MVTESGVKHVVPVTSESPGPRGSARFGGASEVACAGASMHLVMRGRCALTDRHPVGTAESQGDVARHSAERHRVRCLTRIGRSARNCRTERPTLTRSVNLVLRFSVFHRGAVTELSETSHRQPDTFLAGAEFARSKHPRRLENLRRVPFGAPRATRRRRPGVAGDASRQAVDFDASQESG